MPDSIAPVRPRVALVFGDADSTRHLRDAVAGHVDIVYDTPAVDFDDARLVEADAGAALVNLDGGDWLEGITARLRAAGLAVVFNDPEISLQLTDWARARWARHLVAKLSGNTDFDPPRPLVAAVMQSAEPAGVGPSLRPHAAAPGLAIVGEEANTMESEPMQDTGYAAPPESTGTAVPAWQPRSAPMATPESMAYGAAPDDAGRAAGNGLDVDTEALSRLIDQRLAEMDGQADSAHAVVMHVTAGAASSVQPDGTSAVDAVDGRAVRTVSPHGGSADPVDAADPLPKAGNWQLVNDLEVPAASLPATRQAPDRPSAATGLGALEGIGLVPMDTGAPTLRHVDPVEHWMHVEKPRTRSATRVARRGDTPDGEAA